MGKVKKKEYYGEDKLNFVISLVQEGMSATKSVQTMCDKYNLPHNSDVERTYRAKLQRMNLSKPTVEIGDEFEIAKQRVFDSNKQYYLISWAQMDSPIHEEFLTNLETYAKYLDAPIHIICGRYKNSTSLEGSKQQKENEKNKNYWHPRLRPYLDANRQNLHTHLSVLADVKVQVTATTPLTGLNGITALESCVVGHPSLHMKCLPILDGYPNKLLLTTGAVTLPNYSDTKAGKKAEFNHVFGFVIVEVDGDVFHIRQVQCGEDGSFYDLKSFVSNGKVGRYKENCLAIVLGDLHLTEEHEDNVRLSFEMAKWSRSEKVIVHDVFSGVSVSHHDANNAIIQAQKEIDGLNNLQDELNYIYNWFNLRKEYNFVSIMSNHNSWIDRWVATNDWRKNTNKSLYLGLANASVNRLAPKGLIAYLLDRHTTNVESLGYNDSYRLEGWELGLHGDFGTNGSRGSSTQFKNLNTRTITAHSHTPSRELGNLCVGTLTKLRLGYNKGLSGWLPSNVIIYPNAKVSHINIIKGKYSTLIK